VVAQHLDSDVLACEIRETSQVVQSEIVQISSSLALAWLLIGQNIAHPVPRSGHSLITSYRLIDVEALSSTGVPGRGPLSIWAAMLGVAELDFEATSCLVSQSMISLRKLVVA